MNLQNFILAKTFSRSTVSLLVLFCLATPAVAGWKIDLSRRQDDIRKRELQLRGPASAQAQDEGILGSIFNYADPVQELVILNSEKGFTPSTLNIQKGKAYKIHVVNVNQELKNVSFVMDTFSQHHATYYGEIKSFHIQPKKAGVYSFVCPETSAQGKLVVFPSAQEAPPVVDVRMPASE